MANLRIDCKLEAPIGGQTLGPGVAGRLLALSNNLPFVTAFNLTDAATASTQQMVFYDRALTNTFQTLVGSKQAGIIVVDPDNVYDDGSTVPDKIFAEIVFGLTSGAGSDETTRRRVRREVPHVFACLEGATAITAAADTVLKKVTIRNNNASGIGTVKVLLALFG